MGGGMGGRKGGGRASLGKKLRPTDKKKDKQKKSMMPVEKSENETPLGTGGGELALRRFWREMNKGRLPPTQRA